MPNSRPHGTLPAAFARDGKEVPPSPDVAAHALAQVIGQSVAYEMARLLGPVLQRLVDVQEQPACIVCAAKAKRDYETAAANARAAAEPEPDRPLINQSFTIDPAVGPVCWAHFDPDAG